MNGIGIKLHKDREEVVRFCNRFDYIYVYGAGLVSNFIIKYLKEEKIAINGIIVSDGKKTNELYNGIHIYELDEVKADEKIGIVLGVAPVNQEGICLNLKENGFAEKQIYSQRIFWPNLNSCVMYDSLLNYSLGDNKSSNGFFSEFKELNLYGREFGTDKSDDLHNYLCKYEFFIQGWKEKEFNFLELGVLDGGSLKTWEKYFTKANIYGVDINEECKKAEGGRKKICIMDLSDEKNLESLKKIKPSIIVDDASHMWSHQIKSLFHLFDVLPSGGIFIMEDLETSFDAYRNYYFADSCISTYEVCSQISKIVCGNEVIKKENISAAVWEIKNEIEGIAVQIEMISFIHGSCIMIKR